MMHSEMISGWLMIPMLLGILFSGLVIVGIVFFIVKMTNDKNNDDSSIRILKDRYAKGEISDDEYDQKYNRLNKLNNK